MTLPGHPDLHRLAAEIRALRLYELEELRRMLGWDDPEPRVKRRSKKARHGSRHSQ